MIKILKNIKKNVTVSNETPHTNDQSEIINTNTNFFYNFRLYGFILYDNEGKIVVSSLKHDPNNNLNNVSKNIFKDLDIYSSLIKKFILLNKTSKIKNKINFTQIYFQGYKLIILNLFQVNLYLLGFFSSDTKLSIIRLLMLNIYISFLNYLGENSSYIINNNININNEIKNNSSNNSNNKNISIVYSDMLFSKLYENFILYPLIKFFLIITKNIYIRQPAFFENSKFKNLIILNIENNKIIFSFEKLYNLDISVSKNLKINEVIWKEILFHGKQLKHNYDKKYGKLFDINNYQNYYVKLEFYSTFPRLEYVIKFLPILNGLLLIYEYENVKLAKCEDEDLRKYKEIEIIDGCFLYENELYGDFLSFESRITKERDFFLVNFLMSTLSNVNCLYFSQNFKLKYFSREIFNIINDNIQNNKISNINNIDILIKEIFNKLYDEYLLNNNKKKEISNESFNLNKKQQNEKFSFLNNCSIHEHRNDDDENFLNWIDNNSNYMKNLFQISKMFILKNLFSNVEDLAVFDVSMNLPKFDGDVSKIIKYKYPKNLSNNFNIQSEEFHSSESLDDKNSNFSKFNKKKMQNSTIFQTGKIDEKNIYNEDMQLNNSNNSFLKDSFFNFNDIFISEKNFNIQNIFHKSKKNNVYPNSVRLFNRVNNLYIENINRNSFNVLRKTKTKNTDYRNRKYHFYDDLKFHNRNRMVNLNNILEEKKDN